MYITINNGKREIKKIVDGDIPTLLQTALNVLPGAYVITTPTDDFGFKQEGTTYIFYYKVSERNYVEYEMTLSELEKFVSDLTAINQSMTAPYNSDLDQISLAPIPDGVPQADSNALIDSNWLRKGRGSGIDAEFLDGLTIDDILLNISPDLNRFVSCSETSAFGVVPSVVLNRLVLNWPPLSQFGYNMRVSDGSYGSVSIYLVWMYTGFGAHVQFEITSFVRMSQDAVPPVDQTVVLDIPTVGVAPGDIVETEITRVDMSSGDIVSILITRNAVGVEPIGVLGIRLVRNT